MSTRNVRSVAMVLAAISFPTHGAGAGPKPGDVYHSPLHNFDITVPKFPDGTKVQETHDKIHGHVAFAGGAGDMDRIGYQRFDPPPFPAAMGADSILALSRGALAGLDSLARATLVTSLAGLEAPSRAGLLETMDRWILGVNISAHGGAAVPDSAFVGLAALAYMNLGGAQNQLMERFQARPVSREAVLRDSTLMILTVAVSPEGSESMNMSSGKHMDEIFAHLVFVRNGFLYNLKAQPNGFAAGMAASHPDGPNELAQAARRLVLDLYARTTFH